MQPEDGLAASFDAAFQPFAKALSDVVFYSVPVAGTPVPWVVAWLVAGAVFCTLYFRFVNLRLFGHALRLVRGDFDDPDEPGEVSHFQALSTAVSGTVGVGNIAHVAIAISVGGPGAAFWLVVAGLLGMSSKFVECTLGVMYRRQNPDGSVSGGPMFYLHQGFAERGWPHLGRALGAYYAVCVIVGCLGIGSMFQSNQAYVQLVTSTGGAESWFADRALVVGLALAFTVGLVIAGGIQSIARVTSKLVPFMALLYLGTGLFVILSHAADLPGALRAIVVGAFRPEGVAGGALGVMVLGFRRAAFSNEAGIGSAAIAHAAVRTREPVSEGIVALLEPFIDTVVICSVTALVITLTVYDPAVPVGDISGVELTSRAFASVVSWFPAPLSLVVMLFAFSTMIAWSYYGLEGWLYLLGPSRAAKTSWNTIFCASVAFGCLIQLESVLDFSDAAVFAMALANVFGLYVFAPRVKRELDAYLAKLRSGEIAPR